MTVGARYTGSFRILAYCACGGSLDVTSRPPDAAHRVHAAFWEIHAEEGCRPCDAATARRARAKAERKAAS